MAFANYYYHGMTRKYVALFGSLFDKITIERQVEGSTDRQKMIVPIAYGPWQKFLSKKTQDPNKNVPVAIALPRMSFEINGFTYDPSRKVPTVKKFNTEDGSMTYAPIPYNIEFTLNIMTKYIEDLYKIKEQILPFFAPEYCPSVILVDGMPSVDIAINISSISIDDVTEGDFETRRAILGTMTFTMKGYYFGPVREKKVIKFIDVSINEDEAKIESKVFDMNDPDKDYTLVNVNDFWDVNTVIKEIDDPLPDVEEEETEETEETP